MSGRQLQPTTLQAGLSPPGSARRLPAPAPAGTPLAPPPQQQLPRPASSSSLLQDEAEKYLKGPTYGGQAAPPIKLQATPSWAGVPPPPLRSRCSGLRLAVWGAVVLALVGAALGLSVTMAVIHSNNSSSSGGSDDSGGGGSSSGGHGGGGSSGGGSKTPSAPGLLGMPPFAAPAGWTALWWDEFDGTRLDTTKWNYDLGRGNWGWGNNESQTYTNSEANVRVANGSLALTALRDARGAFTSGRINSLNNAAFYPGMLAAGVNYSAVHIEFRIKLPSPGKGLWPAAWCYPVQLKYGPWAASGEIDVMETNNDMVQLVQGLHYAGPYPTANKMDFWMSQQGAQWTPWSNDFHTYSVDWAADSIAFSIDGQPRFQRYSRSVDTTNGWFTRAYADAPPNEGTGPNAPFDMPFYIIMNLAVGGLFSGPTDATTPASSTMLVDYVRVWALPQA